MTNKKYYTTYAIASHWLEGGLVLCNNIWKIDPSVFNNMRFDYYDTETDTEAEIYQWFLTNWTENEVEWLEKTFSDLHFTYSEELDCFVLCVDHFGTMWNGVECECSEEWAEYNKDLLITKENRFPEYKKTITY